MLPLQDFVAGSEGPFRTGASAVSLRENDKTLGPKTRSIEDVARGGGCHLHFGDALLFSTSDNSDPNKNGRVYEPFVGLNSVGAYSSKSQTFSDLPYVDRGSHTFVDMRTNSILRDFYDDFQRHNRCKFKGLKDSADRAAVHLRIGNSGSSAAVTSIAESMRTYAFGAERDFNQTLDRFLREHFLERSATYNIYTIHDRLPILPLVGLATGRFAQYFTFLRDPRRMFPGQYYRMETLRGAVRLKGKDYQFEEWLDSCYRSYKGRLNRATLQLSSWFTDLDRPFFSVLEELLTKNFQTAEFNSPYEKALKAAEDLFFFIGIAEHFDESLFVLYLLLDLPLMPLWGYDHRSVRPTPEELPPAYSAKIEELVEIDLRFYDCMRKRFETTFAKEIEFFRKNVKSLRGYVVPDKCDWSCNLADGYFALSFAPAAPEIGGPWLSLGGYYTAQRRQELHAADTQGWWATRANLEFDQTILGPDGQFGALKLIEDQSEYNSHIMRLHLGDEFEGQHRTVFAFVKGAGRTNCALWLYTNGDATRRAEAGFSLETGETDRVGVIGDTWHNAKAGCVRTKDGWWWIWLSADTHRGPSGAAMLIGNEDANCFFDGDGRSGIYVFDPRMIGDKLRDWGW